MFKNSKVVFKKNTVIKKSLPKLAKIEFIKTIKAISISKKFNLFQVPEIYDYDEKNGIIIFERIHNLKGLGCLNFNKDLYKNVISKTGESLAIIHNNLQLPYNMKIALDEKIDFPGDKIYFHGDFSVENVNIINNTHKLIILDWQMTNIHGGKATYGTRYFDIAWFINNLFSKPIYKYLFSRDIDNLAKLFLDSYFNICNDTNCNKYDFFRYLRFFFNNNMQERTQHFHWLKKIILLYGHNLWEKFINSNDLKRKF
jgi:tRNA A-37 threonylcarbamoyl transferase component Bud32